MKPQLYILTGASRGMGLAMARQILEQGHHLITMARHRNDALEAVAQTHQATLQQWQHDLAAPSNCAAGWLHRKPAVMPVWC